MRLPKDLMIKEPIFYKEYKDLVTKIPRLNSNNDRVKAFKKLFKAIFQNNKSKGYINQIYLFYWDAICKKWVGPPHAVFKQAHNSSYLNLFHNIEKDFKISFRDFICTSEIHNRPTCILRSVKGTNYVKQVTNCPLSH